jgi:adenylate kinase family enzyme
MGPAGVGKSTYCKTIQEHCSATRRRMHVANLDPAADQFE